MAVRSSSARATSEIPCPSSSADAVRVIVDDKNGKVNTVAELGAGELIGEMAVVTGESRSATVEAIRDTHIAKLSRSSFERFMTRHPSAAVQMVSRKLAQRLQETTAGKTSQQGYLHDRSYSCARRRSSV